MIILIFFSEYTDPAIDLSISTKGRLKEQTCGVGR